MAKYKKRADGRYATSVTYCGKKFYFTAKTSPELDRKVQEFKIAKRSGTYSSGMLFEDWAASWMASIKNTVEPTTYISYTCYLNNHIMPSLGRMPLCNIQPQNIRDLMIDVNQKLCGNTAGRVYSILNRILQTAVDDDMLVKHPMRGMKSPSKKLKNPRVFLTEQQFQQYLDYIDNSKYADEHLFVMLALLSGLRRGEILGLRTQDIDFNKCTISVKQVAKKIGRETVISQRPKTSASRRTVSLPATIFSLIKAQIKANRLKAMSDALWQQNDLLFPGPHGEPAKLDTISQRIIRSGQRAGMPAGFNLHSLRHTSASLLLQRGVNYKVVQRRLGHNSAMTTLNVYSHVLPGDDERAAETLADII